VRSGEQRPILVVAAHPDDEVLGFAGVLAHAVAAGRPAYAALVTNGDSPIGGRARARAGAGAGAPARTLGYGLRRNREAVAALRVLGLRWRRDPFRSAVFFLGYPNGALEEIAASARPWEGDPTGLHRTYAEDFDLRRSTCNGDLRWLLEGEHAALSARDLAADLDSLLRIVQPGDVYTHVDFDGHPDHAEVHRQVLAACRRSGASTTVHGTLIHPAGTRDRMYESALEWPNPPDGGDPFARFAPHLAFAAPPGDDGSAWGPLAEPTELVDVPPSMLEADPRRNLKWRAISKHRSQINCAREGGAGFHPSCGYLRAFVKRHEFFWSWRVEAGVEVGVA
jgi:LmbE family N-acetylglucosaminyl deacetylase